MDRPATAGSVEDLLHINPVLVASFRAFLTNGNETDALKCDKFRHSSALSLLDANGNVGVWNNAGKLFEKRSASLPEATPRTRPTSHANAEEALNSLLWQPYEYQNNTSSFDLAECTNNNEGTQTGNIATDLHLTEDMVNNLSELPDQSKPLSSPRDPPLTLASRLSTTTTAVPDNSCSSCATCGSVSVCDDITSSPESVCDVCEILLGGDMHLEVPSVVRVTSNDPTTQRTVSSPRASADFSFANTDPPFLSATINNLSSANVVGLPTNNHPRQASVPCTKTPFALFANHARNSSEPCTVLQANQRNDVSCYRAVPVNVISSVPTIQCLNSTTTNNNNDAVVGNNVSNVQIMPLSDPAPNHFQTQVANVQRATRTFTSTEAQTDEVREPRRRERRQHRRSRHERALPDILNSHMPPPYSPIPQRQAPIVANVVPSAILPFPQSGQVSLVPGSAAVGVASPNGFRFPFPATGIRARYSEVQPKGCCGLPMWKPGSLRWFIVLIALVGVCCVLVGTALGAMRPAGRDHLTVSLLMIGVGIILVTVSGVAWRLTSHDTSTCRSLWGLSGSTESVDVCGGAGARRFMPRLPPSYGRPHHPYAAMMYPEFQYRPPPPSYQASMQEYRLRLLLLDRSNTPQTQNVVSPPPTYRSHAGSLLRTSLGHRREATQSEYSCPPSYRSQTSSSRQAAQNNVTHSREQSVSLEEANCEDSVVNVVSIFNGAGEEDIVLDNLTIESMKMEPETDLSALNRLSSGKGSSCDLEEGNLVTIVQTSDQSPVIVTVSGNSHPHLAEIPPEMEILAHL